MSKRQIGLVLLAALFGSALFLVSSYRAAGLGFPLDDAWIHQTYARNLVEYREWSFVPGRPSAGSTSPPWTLLLALGHAMGIDYLWWTYGLGLALLAGNALLGAELSRRLFPQTRWAWPLTALAMALEWHLVWSSVSGMETLLFTLLVLGVFVSISPDTADRTPTERALFRTGLLIGLSMAVRPDGATLLPFALLPSAMGLFSGSASTPSRKLLRFARQASALASGLGLMLLPYLAFNLRLGAIWPNTFYAKQAEYAAYLLLPLHSRFLQLLAQPFVGGQVLLIPGLVLALAAWFRDRSWSGASPVLWALGFVGLYALRLPVTYQHGRYMMPVVVAVLPLGVGGTVEWVAGASGRLAGRILGRAWAISIGMTWVVFLGLGARAYLADVGFIETNLVRAAKWVAVSTEPESVVAAHDIGALGYFGSRDVLDLAGLISPDVIPIIRDEQAIEAFIQKQGADYLLVFPSWYPALVQSSRAMEVQAFVGSYAPASIGHPVLFRWNGGNSTEVP